MIPLDQFLTDLRQRNVKLWVEDGRLRFRAAKGVMTRELKDELAARKDTILALLDPSQFAEIPRIPDQPDYELSHAQRRLWVLTQLDEDSAAYNIPLHLSIDGRFDPAALQTALNQVVARHESLRTVFITLDGEPRQKVLPSLSVPVEVIDASDDADAEATARRLAREEARRPFDLATGPLLRLVVVRLAEQRHVVLCTMHHIISDGWSIAVLSCELLALYEAARKRQSIQLPLPAIQYRDYSAWQNQQLDSGAMKVHRDYWLKQLAGELPVLDLPTDSPRASAQTFRGRELFVEIDARTAAALRAIGQHFGASLSMTLLALVNVLLYRYTGQSEVIVGAPVAGRSHPQLDDQIGFYLNMVAYRSKLQGDQSFGQFLVQVKEMVGQALEHQAYPLDCLIDEIGLDRDLSRSALFDVVVIHQIRERLETRMEDARVDFFATEPGVSKFDLTFDFREHDAGLHLGIEYNTDLFRHDRIERMAAHLRELARSIIDDCGTRIDSLNFLPETEKRLVTEAFNDTSVEMPRASTLVDLLEQRGAESADDVAVVFEDRHLTYAQLHRDANRLARYLQSLGVGPDVRVGICVERSLEMVVALLGILKAGGAYVPLDPSFPRDRLALILQDSQASILVTERALTDLLPTDGIRLVALDADWDRISQMSEAAPATELRPHHLAYVIYTSGSTGRPKGVQIPHGALVNFLLSMAGRPGLNSCDVLLAVTTLSFDISGLEIYLPLICGARIVLAGDQVTADGHELARLLDGSGATVMQATPATWRLLLASGWQGRPQLNILCGGEAMPQTLAAQLVDKGRAVWNLYGPTETTIWSTVYELTARADSDEAVVPIGRPIANTQVFVLDGRLNPVPIGIPGELCIAGDGLARGYYNRPDLNAEKFIPHPFSNQPNQRLYRTGDLARFRPDGNLEFLGRIDQQVKIRGFRIELEEIESVLATHADVRESVVTAQQDSSGDKRLVAYYVAAGDTQTSATELADHLRRKLPEYCVPAVFQRLDALPLTPNGKVNRRGLPAPDAQRPELACRYVPPRNNTERSISALWRQILDVERVGVHDSFFDLGGHSLKATRLIARLQRDLGVHVRLRELFEHPTVAGLAGLVDSTGASVRESNVEDAALTAIVPISSEDRASQAGAITPMTDEELELLSD